MDALFSQWLQNEAGLFVYTAPAHYDILKQEGGIAVHFKVFPSPLQDANDTQDAVKWVRRGHRVLASLGEISPDRIPDALYTRNVSRESIITHLKGIAQVMSLPTLCPNCAIPEENPEVLRFAEGLGVSRSLQLTHGEGCSNCTTPSFQKEIFKICEWEVKGYRGVSRNDGRLLRELTSLVSTKQMAIGAVMQVLSH